MARGIVVAMVGGLVLLLTLAFAVPPTFATTPSGQIDFYTVSGTNTCTSTVWPTTGYDGNIGFPSNLPGGSNIHIAPSAGTGTSYICIVLTLTDQAPNTVYSVYVSGSTIMSNTQTCTTDSNGDAVCTMIFTLTVLPGCATNPIFISPKVSGTGGTGNQVHHITNLNYDNGICTIGAPEFPYGLLGLFAVAAPALLILRKRALRFA